MLKTGIWLIIFNLYLLVRGVPESLQDQMFIKLKAMKEEHEAQIQEMSKIIEDQKRIIEAYNETVRTVNQFIETGEQSKSSLLPAEWSFGQGNIFTPVCHSFCSQGGVPDQAPPPDQTGTPRDQASTPPPQDQAGTPLPTTPTPPPPARAGKLPPGPDPHPWSRHPPPQEAADSGIWPTFSRYASYWNAFLYCHMIKRRNRNQEDPFGPNSVIFIQFSSKILVK